MAARIANDVIKLESEGIIAIKQIIALRNHDSNSNRRQKIFDNLSSRQSTQENGYNNDDESNIKEEYDPNRKFDHRTRLIDKRNMLNGLAY